MGWTSRIPAIAAVMHSRVDSAVKATAQAVERDAKARVPVNSGNLRDAIHVENSGVSEYSVIAGNSTAFYGHYVEFGTSHAPAHPFLIPAAESARTQILAAGLRALKGI